MRPSCQDILLLMTKANGKSHGETWRGKRRKEQEEVGKVEWVDSGQWQRRPAGWTAPPPVPAVPTAWRSVLSAHKCHRPRAEAPLWFLPITPFASPSRMSSPPAPLPPILHQYSWHIPVLIVQAEPLALCRICIRMLFLYNCKQRHVGPLLNCSANRRRF